ncbi:hypothetical protein PG997_008969 [Apiospora hydei]|uniref:F-box domain-containing protein n=1 Tax=Apiospora hydei TaxID=1337664 RepID=A0ABR1WC94_9PEZI
MASGFFKVLPPELLVEIGGFLPLEDQQRVSAVDARLRRVLAPLLFSTIRITNNSSDQDAIDQIVTKYGHHVRGLALTMDLGRFWEDDKKEEGGEDDDEGGDDDGDNDGNADSEAFHAMPSNLNPFPGTPVVVPYLFEDDEYSSWLQNRRKKEWERPADWILPGLPVLTRDLLTVQKLPGVSSVSIRFACDFHNRSYEDWHDWRAALADDNYSMSYDPEQVEHRLSTLDNMWQALTLNVQIRQLAAKELLPVARTPFWSQPAWSAFLGRLETLELGFWEGRPDDWPEKHAFQSDLNLHFYRHLSGKASPLRRLVLVAAPDSPIGPDAYTLGAPYRLSSPKGYMPHIRELRLENCILHPDLATFIAERGRSSLRAVELINCASIVHPGTRRTQRSPMTWMEFFNTIIRSGDRRDIVLEQFRLVRTRDIKLVEGEEMWMWGERA